MNIFRRIFRRLFLGSEAYQAAEAEKHTKRLAARAYAQRKRLEKAAKTLKEAHQASTGTFIIADLETTGLSSKAEILELAAIKADATGVVLEEMSLLVRPRRGIPADIVRLTGITPAMVRARGIRIEEAFPRFVDFCGKHPVFFHNAGFDKRFVLAAADALGYVFENPVLCTLRVARAAWPELPSHKLAVLAQHIGAPAPTHRGLDDVKATLQVLLAARREAAQRLAA